jgi:SAM-dependent methyltransferase
MLRPDPALAARIRELISSQLGGVLPPAPARGVDRYYDWVVLGGRSLEAYRVVRRCRPPVEEPVLDVGCGLGSFVLLANRCGMAALGVEPSREELELARRRAAAGDPSRTGPFLEAVGERLPFGRATFSAVVLHDVLEHVDDWRGVIRECRRVLVTGGIVYVKGPSYTVRFVEPHYLVPWLPLLPRPLARRYLAALGRDVSYFENVYYRRRGEVQRELVAQGFSLSFPRHAKLAEPETINREWVRRAASSVSRSAALSGLLKLAADNPLQSTIDVVGHLRSR